MVAKKVNLLGFAEYRDEGEKMLAAPADAVAETQPNLLCVAAEDDNALRALIKSMKPNVVLP